MVSLVRYGKGYFWTPFVHTTWSLRKTEGNLSFNISLNDELLTDVIRLYICNRKIDIMLYSICLERKLDVIKMLGNAMDVINRYLETADTHQQAITYS